MVLKDVQFVVFPLDENSYPFMLPVSGLLFFSGSLDMIDIMTEWSTPARVVLIELLDSIDVYIMVGGIRSI